jgi:hypothetical protein
MNLSTSIPDTPFDPIELELKLNLDFERSQQTEKFCQNYREEPRISFEDGKWDGMLDFEPEAYQWLVPNYRQGYLAGVEAKFNELFAS